jgi:hypothetical protein
MEFRRQWAPLIIVAAYSVALLIPALMPSVEAQSALPSMSVVASADVKVDIGAEDLANDAMMAELHAQASAALRDLQMAQRQYADVQ